MNKEKLSLKMGERLRKLRKSRGLSYERLQAAISEKYGVEISKDSLINYEVSDENHTKRFKNNGMRVEYLRYFSDFYHVSADYLLALSDIKATDSTTRDICEKTGLSEHTVSRLMQDDKRDRWAEVIDQLVLHPGVLDALHAYLFFDVDYFATVEDGKASDDHRKVMVLGDSAQGKVVPVYPRMMDGALQLEVQRELSDIKRQLKKARADHAKEKG